MAYEFTGTVKEIMDVQTFASGFKKRGFVVTSENSKYPQDIQFECLKDRIEMVDQLSKGDRITIHFDLNGREWNGKYFVNLVAWKIDQAKTGSSEAGPAQTPEEPDEEDVPF